jgi:hypothetical protein
MSSTNRETVLNAAVGIAAVLALLASYEAFKSAVSGSKTQRRSRLIASKTLSAEEVCYCCGLLQYFTITRFINLLIFLTLYIGCAEPFHYLII